jgi:hypothetical protein
MIRVAISVEGQTEDEFCKQILASHFLQKGIQLIPIIVTTKREKCGVKHKGGCINLDRIKSEITKLLSSFDYVTTFYDLYGFDGVGIITADELEQKMSELFSNRKFIPYIQKYEFETLLFSEPSYYEEYFSNQQAQLDIETIINIFNGNIEEINNSKETAPSKRMIKFFDNYDESFDKVFHGYSIIEEIGLQKVLEKAPRFRAWIEKIESLTK